MRRQIKVTVKGERVKLSNRVIGTAGSYNNSDLILSFDSAWDNTTKSIYMTDSTGAVSVKVILTADFYSDGVYTVLVPSEPLSVAGECTLAIDGVELDDDDDVVRSITATATRLQVLPSLIPSEVINASTPTASDVEQIQASIDVLIGSIGDATQAVTDAETAAGLAQEAVDSIQDMTVSTTTLSAGSTATADVSTNDDGSLNIAFGLVTGATGAIGTTGATGVSITDITKTGTNGLVDTYTITFSNSETTTYTVTNGEKGDTGEGLEILGIYSTLAELKSAHTVGEAGQAYAVGTSNDNDIYVWSESDFDWVSIGQIQGEIGATGNGIVSITLTATSGLVDTYTILFTDGTSTTFSVSNGADGTTFTPSVATSGDLSWTNDGGLTNPTTVNVKGADGQSAYEVAVENGFVGDEDAWLASLVGDTGADGLTTSITLNNTTYTVDDNGNIDLGGVAELDSNGKVPTDQIPSHASEAATYGTGTGTAYGHVKLSDAIDSDSDVDDGVAATPKAVKAVADKFGDATNFPMDDIATELMSDNFSKAFITTYEGTGSSTTSRTIITPFVPKAFISWFRDGTRSYLGFGVKGLSYYMDAELGTSSANTTYDDNLTWYNNKIIISNGFNKDNLDYGFIIWG